MKKKYEESNKGGNRATEANEERDSRKKKKEEKREQDREAGMNTARLSECVTGSIIRHTDQAHLS